MNRSQKQDELLDLDQIEDLIISCGLIDISNSSSANKINSINSPVNMIQKTMCSSRDDIWEK